MTSARNLRRSLALAAAALLGGLAVAGGPTPAAAVADAGIVYFDPATRQAQLARPDHAVARAACLAIPSDPDWIALPPLAALEETEGYGTDNRAAPFAWAVMVLGGRALAADGDAARTLKTLLTLSLIHI